MLGEQLKENKFPDSIDHIPCRNVLKLRKIAKLQGTDTAASAEQERAAFSEDELPPKVIPRKIRLGPPKAAPVKPPVEDVQKARPTGPVPATRVDPKEVYETRWKARTRRGKMGVILTLNGSRFRQIGDIYRSLKMSRRNSVRFLVSDIRYLLYKRLLAFVVSQAAIAISVDQNDIVPKTHQDTTTPARKRRRKYTCIIGSHGITKLHNTVQGATR